MGVGSGGVNPVIRAVDGGLAGGAAGVPGEVVDE